MNPRIKISAVSYLNTLPFIYGLEHSGLLSTVELSRDIPSECARKLLAGEVDVGLVPVAVLPELADSLRAHSEGMSRDSSTVLNRPECSSP